MKYLSVDIETTGLNPETDKILEVAMIIEDTNNLLPKDECPTLHFYVWHESYTGTAKALAMNVHTFQKISEIYEQKWQSRGRYDPAVPNVGEMNWEQEIGYRVRKFFKENGIDEKNKITLAGANLAGFDMKFLEKVLRESTLESFNRRVLEPSHYYTNLKDDEKLCTLADCKKRAGIEGEVKHNALDDAWDVIQILRTKY